MTTATTLLCALCVSCTLGCGDTAGQPVVRGRVDAGYYPVRDAGALGAGWGDFAGGLMVPACSTDSALVVNTIEHDSDVPEGLRDPSAAGPTLSLAEALTIAQNRVGRDTLTFDPDVFPSATPGIIDIACDDKLYAYDVCLDGRDRGVVLRWPESDARSPCLGTFTIEEDSLVVGLTFLHVPLPAAVVSRSTIAGCRMNTDGVRAYPGAAFFDLNAYDAIVGPGNVFIDRWGLSIKGPSPVTVRGNYFGLDPVTRAIPGIDNAIEVDLDEGSPGTIIWDNIFAVIPHGHLFWSPTAASIVQFHNNGIGVDRTWEPLPGDWEGVRIGDPDGTFSIGFNVIRGTRRAIEISYNINDGRWPAVRITHNNIYGNDEGIVFVEPPTRPIEPPRILVATATSASGSCVTPGDVEIFHDAGDQGEIFLDVMPCTTEAGWSARWSEPVRSGRNITATLTRDDNSMTSAFSTPFPVP